MEIKKGKFRMKDGVYFVTYQGRDMEDISLCDEDQENRRLYLKESMSMIDEEVEFRIVKKFLAKGVEYYAKLVWTEEKYSLEDVLEAAKYGYEYHEKTAHPEEPIPNGNILQWLMARKKMTQLPNSWLKYRDV